MDVIELRDLIKKGEDSSNQFKVRIDSPRDLAAEIVAFANTRGGNLYIGVDSEGNMIGIDSNEMERVNQMISNACSQLIDPPIKVETENVVVDYERNKVVVVIKVPMGANKFYLANSRDVWVKVGADKRRASREELRRLLQESGELFADEQLLEGTGIADFDLDRCRNFIEQRIGQSIEEQDLSFEQLLSNLKLVKDKKCTLAGLLLFGKSEYWHDPRFVISAVSWVGDDPAENEYLDSEDISGNIVELFKGAKSFLKRQLRKRQGNQGFNTRGILEIPEDALEEALVNALVHRNYFMNSYIRIMVFDNRVEINSPGLLPNTLTIESIKLGVHSSRNPVILSAVKDIPKIPYRGMGTGVRRIITSCEKAGIDVEFINEKETEQFKVVFWRK